MTRSTSGRTGRRAGSDERLNEEFHTLLRRAAEERAGRARIQESGDAAAARQESANLLALARGQRFERSPARR
ncbi:MAG: hypothetical protein ABSA21_08245 [Candidatus Limnocylindrales bacterium]|jgi:hypothetical protein